MHSLRSCVFVKSDLQGILLHYVTRVSVDEALIGGTEGGSSKFRPGERCFPGFSTPERSTY